MFRYTIKQLEEFSDEKMISAVMVERQESCTNIYSPLYKRLSRLYNRFYRLDQHNDKVIGLKFVEETLQNESSLKGDEIMKVMRILKEGLENPKVRC